MCRSWFSLSGPMVWVVMRRFKSSIFRLLAARAATPAPGKEILEVEAKNSTLSSVPFFRHSAYKSSKVSGVSVRSWTQ